MAWSVFPSPIWERTEQHAENRHLCRYYEALPFQLKSLIQLTYYAKINRNDKLSIPLGEDMEVKLSPTKDYAY